MGCCGQKRTALKKASLKMEPSTAMRPAQLGVQLQGKGRQVFTQTDTTCSTVSLRYLESSAILVQGSVTGRRYKFSSGTSIQSIDARDAVSLLRTKFFQQIY